MSPDATTRFRAAVAAALCVPLGLGAKRAPADGIADWVADHFAGALYVVFWCCAAFAVFPRATRGTVVSAVLLLTFGVEFLQLSDAGWLESLRARRLPALVLGSTFSWTDFPYYAAGALAAWWLAAWITARPPTR